MILLDTHVLVWARTDDRKLGRSARLLISKHWAQGTVATAAITFWEIGILATRGRLRLDRSVHEWRASVLADGVIEFPIDGETAVRALDLTALPADPVDRFIVAAALVRGASLVTADDAILDWRHSMERHDARA